MAKTRMINTRFWSDEFIRDHLNPLERYVFLYFLTNDKTNICGVYELPKSIVSDETGLDRSELDKIISKLFPKIMYIDSWVIIPNFIKHQNARSPQVLRGIEAELKQIPKGVKDRVLIQYGYDIDTLSHSNTNININTNPNINDDTLSTPKGFAKSFFNNSDEREKVVQSLISKGMPEFLVRREMSKFVNYWSELTPTGKKQKWETQKTFEVNRRLATWFSNAQQWSQQKTVSKGKPIIGL